MDPKRTFAMNMAKLREIGFKSHRQLEQKLTKMLETKARDKSCL